MVDIEVRENSGGKYVEQSYLTPVGAVLGYYRKCSRRVYLPSCYTFGEWTGSEFIENKYPRAVSGDYAYYYDLVGGSSLRQFSTGETTTISPFFNELFAFMENGSLLFGESGEIKKYQAGSISTVASIGSLNNPVVLISNTDDDSILYISHPDYVKSTRLYSINKANEIVLSETSFIYGSNQQYDTQANKKWVAFAKNRDIERQIWTIDPEGVLLQRTFFNASSFIEKLSANGEVILTSDGKRYFSDATGKLTHIGSASGKVYLIGNIWYRSMGSSLFKIKLDLELSNYTTGFHKVYRLHLHPFLYWGNILNKIALLDRKSFENNTLSQYI